MASQLTPPTNRAKKTDLKMYSGSIFQQDCENFNIRVSTEAVQSYL